MHKREVYMYKILNCKNENRDNGNNDNNNTQGGGKVNRDNKDADNGRGNGSLVKIFTCENTGDLLSQNQ